MAGIIGFVPPRYGPDVVGGAEAVIAEAAHGLAERGYKVEILTTCAKDHYTWANHYAPGEEWVDNLCVRRFPVEIDPKAKNRDIIGHRILAGENVSLQDQQLWANDSLRSSELWHYISNNGERYRALVYAPYQFWTTYAVSQIYSHKSLLMPCLHDEPEAYLEIYKPVIEGAAGVWFLTDPERDLANKIFAVPNSSEVVGAAVDVPTSYDPVAFRSKFGINEPFLYFAGRREWGKGWTQLVEAFAKANVTDLKLVTSGVGEVTAPPEVLSRIVDIGFISDDDRNSAMAAAVAYVQPSDRESFSRTVLEAWLAGTPVIANGRSDVVAWHIDRSKAGFYYNTESEFVEAIRVFAENPVAAKELAQSGRQYVLQNYQWPTVLDNMERTLKAWFPEEQGG